MGGTLPSDVVTCLYRTTDGRLWCGSFGNGLFYWDGEAFVLPDNEQLKGKNMEYIAGFAEEQSGENVSQIAWQIGLSPKQFAKYFKEAYGMLPSEYKKK